MSDDMAGARRTNLINALRRCFPGLDTQPGAASTIADELMSDAITFGDQPVVVPRNFDRDDPILAAFLAPMGDWAKVLLDALSPDVAARRLRWAPAPIYFLFTEPAE